MNIPSVHLLKNSGKPVLKIKSIGSWSQTARDEIGGSYLVSVLGHHFGQLVGVGDTIDAAILDWRDKTGNKQITIEKIKEDCYFVCEFAGDSYELPTDLKLPPKNGW